MAIKDLQDEILVKDQDGSFKVLKGNKLTAAPSDDLIVPKDDLLVIQEEQFNGKPVADFYFDVSDENELRAFKDKKQEKRGRVIRSYMRHKTEEIIRQAGLGKLAGQDAQLKGVIESYLRGLRSLALTKERLKEIKLGKEAASDWRQVLLDLLKKEKQIMEDILKSGKIPLVKESLADKTKIDKQALKEKLPAEDNWGIKYQKEYQVVHSNELPKSMVMGPVEELKAISLADFRKMADSPQEAAEKILEKISYLEDESLIKRAEGIKAWKQSELYKLYLQIGNLSLAQKKPVERVIFELREAGQPYLTPVEFQAIADLNNRLSY